MTKQAAPTAGTDLSERMYAARIGDLAIQLHQANARCASLRQDALASVALRQALESARFELERQSMALAALRHEIRSREERDRAAWNAKIEQAVRNERVVCAATCRRQASSAKNKQCPGAYDGWWPRDVAKRCATAILSRGVR